MSRSAQMRRIRGRDTVPELVLRRLLARAAYRFRVDLFTLGSRPDIVFTKHRIAVFIDGCFWHGCPEHYVRPRTNEAFWSGKLVANVERDHRHTLKLMAAGWRVLRFWEHEIEQDAQRCCADIIASIQGREIERTRWRVRVVDVLDPKHEIERRLLVDLLDMSMTSTIVGPRVSRSGGAAGRRARR